MLREFIAEVEAPSMSHMDADRLVSEYASAGAANRVIRLAKGVGLAAVTAGFFSGHRAIEAVGLGITLSTEYIDRVFGGYQDATVANMTNAARTETPAEGQVSS